MNWFAYRLPGDAGIVSYKSARLFNGIKPGGFVISPFDKNPRNIVTIPADEKIEGLYENKEFVSENTAYEFPDNSTSESEHRSGVDRIISHIKRGKLEKCVLSRVIVENCKIDIESIFNQLLYNYPDAFVFCFHTPVSGTWIGASPESLARCDGVIIKTMALAGTRPAGTIGEWSEKDIREQKYVLDYILKEIPSMYGEIRVFPTKTVKAGPVEHLMTQVEINMCEALNIDHIEKLSPINLALLLSPTPALCGLPLENAKKLISEVENFERGYYGGFCGPIDNSGKKFNFFVNLRSMMVEKDRFCIFSGGGIVKESIPEAEWKETERKAETMLNVIIKNNI